MSKKEIITINNNPEYDQLLLNVGETLEQGRRRTVAAVNTAMVQTYWETGRRCPFSRANHTQNPEEVIA